MIISKEKFDSIVKKYPTLLIVEDDPAKALRFALDVFTAEIEAVEEKYPDAWSTIERNEAARYDLYNIVSDAEEGGFSEE